MTEQWKIWAFESSAVAETYTTTCVWETETAPFRFTECGHPLEPGAEFFCPAHDGDAADADLIDPDDYDAQHAHHQALAVDLYRAA